MTFFIKKMVQQLNVSMETKNGGFMGILIGRMVQLMNMPMEEKNGGFMGFGMEPKKNRNLP